MWWDRMKHTEAVKISFFFHLPKNLMAQLLPMEAPVASHWFRSIEKPLLVFFSRFLFILLFSFLFFSSFFPPLLFLFLSLLFLFSRMTTASVLQNNFKRVTPHRISWDRKQITSCFLIKKEKKQQIRLMFRLFSGNWRAWLFFFPFRFYKYH